MHSKCIIQPDLGNLKSLKTPPGGKLCLRENVSGAPQEELVLSEDRKTERGRQGQI